MFERKKDDIVISQEKWHFVNTILGGTLYHSLDYKGLVTKLTQLAAQQTGTRFELLNHSSPRKILQFVRNVLH